MSPDCTDSALATLKCGVGFGSTPFDRDCSRFNADAALSSADRLPVALAVCRELFFTFLLATIQVLFSQWFRSLVPSSLAGDLAPVFSCFCTKFISASERCRY